MGLPWRLNGKESAFNAGTRVLGREDPLEEEMATHASILAWEIPWTEEPGGLQSLGSQKESDTTAKQQRQTCAPFAPWNFPGWLRRNSYRSILC